MAASSSSPSSKLFTRFWPWFFFATAFESLLALLALLLVPSEGGMSLARLGLLAILFVFLIGGCGLGFFARGDSVRFDAYARTPIILTSTLLGLTSGVALFLLRYLDPEKFLPYYERLSPLFWYLCALGIQAAVFLLLIKNGFNKQGRKISELKSVYFPSLIIFCSLLFVLLFAAWTKLGIKPDTGYWGEPGVAILGWQFVLSILLGFTTLLGLQSPHKTNIVPRMLLPLGLYLTASILWLSVPVDSLRSSFYAPITPPANMPFPYSDAGFYDYLSQSLLIGTNYLGGIPPRPFYVFFLAVLHFFLGQNYPAIITAQTLVLALFPVALYFLGRKLHSPAAGVTVALFATFRELVGLWISSNTRVANSKLFTTDFPTAMGLAILCLVLVWWLERRDLKSTLIAGGFFGLVLLFRTQSLLVLPFVFVLAWFAYQRKTAAWISAGVVFTAALGLTVLPWLTRNYIVAGQFAFDDPRQTAIIYSQYSLTGNLDLSQFDPARDSVGARVMSFTLEHPAYVAGFITAHILNTEIGGLLALPLIERFDSLLAPVNLYWVAWDGTLAWYNVLLLIIYLAIISVGFGAAWRRAGWRGLVPLAVNLGYTAANGVSRFSGWRYNLPVDWIIYFYFAVGVIEILSVAAHLFGARVQNGRSVPDVSDIKPIVVRDFRPQFSLILLAFMVVGALPWFGTALASPRYTSSQEQLTAELEANGFESSEIQFFLAQPDAVLLNGRILYPRMYRRDEGLSSAHPWPAYAIRAYPRLGFILINAQQYNLIFPTKDLLDFPQGADAIVLACRNGDHLDVRVIVFADQAYQSAPLTQTCTNP